MKKIVFALAFMFSCAALWATENGQSSEPMDSNRVNKTIAAEEHPFSTHISNAEYQVWIDIDLYKRNIKVPNQEVLGEMPGYIGAKRDTRKWLILDSVIDGNKALLTITNDYGSEDLKALLTANKDGTYTFEQKSGSTIKIVVNNKWVKLPKKMIFTKEK